MPRQSAVRHGPKKQIPVIEAKAKVLDLIQQGFKVEEAMRVVHRSAETYRDWRKTDPKFKDDVDGIRSARSDEATNGKAEVPDFPEFCEVWLKQPLSEHQLRVWDMVRGEQPRNLHPSMTYRPGYLNRVLINLPPDHAKTTTWTVNYTVWLIHKNPDVRIVLVSKGNDLAKDFLYEIKQKLTSSLYREMHIRFAPEGGWKDPDSSWTSDAIYVAGKNSTDGVQKDPTVQVLGFKGQIYGRRADLVILDDLVDVQNANEIPAQVRKLDREIESRLPPESEGGGLLMVLGTRVAPTDLYRYLIDVQDADDNFVWSYLRMPAVLDYGDGDSGSWQTLWPSRWDGKSLSRKRREANWNLIYQQMNVDEEMTFRYEAVEASINSMRFPGPMTPEGMGHRKDGMRGLYVVGGLDPATVGCTAMIVAGLDRDTEKRYVLDGFNMANCPPHVMRETIKRLTDTYHIDEWVIERNAFQRYLTQDRVLQDFLRSRSCRLTEHYTTGNKKDTDFGVQTMGPLFESCGVPDPKSPSGKWKRTPDKALVELPNPRQNQWANELVQQLTTWQPEGLSQHHKTDLVMALWFTHIAFDRVVRRVHKKTTHLSSPFTSPAMKKQQRVINLAEIREQKRRLEEAV